jgi:hypothetical protein
MSELPEWTPEMIRGLTYEHIAHLHNIELAGERQKTRLANIDTLNIIAQVREWLKSDDAEEVASQKKKLPDSSLKERRIQKAINRKNWIAHCSDWIDAKKLREKVIEKDVFNLGRYEKKERRKRLAKLSKIMRLEHKFCSEQDW